MPSDSQPLVESNSAEKIKSERAANPSLKRSRSVGPGSFFPSPKRTSSTMSLKTRDRIIEGFTDRYIKTINKDHEYTADSAEIKLIDKTSVHLFYFIGRLNPPHNGHIHALQHLVTNAKSKGSTALILLGSGPTQKDSASRRTMDDPITYELKKEFIVSMLPHGKEGVDYVIQEMTSPFKDVPRYISSTLKNVKFDANIETVHITHLAGGKDDDAIKLKSVLDFGKTIASQNFPSAAVFGEVDVAGPPPSEPGEARKYMSATNVRKATYISSSYENNWPDRYKIFYGPFAERIYNEIKFPLNELPLIERDDAVENYIKYDKLPKKIKVKTTKRKTTKGGIKRRLKSRRKQ